MSRHLPSLSNLQAFEAAARHLSFTAAADESRITQSAVSRRIRQLEDFLGVALFLRRQRRIKLTEAGRELFADVGYLLDEVAETVERVAGMNRVRILALSSLPTLSSEWLMPRLHEFTRRNAGFDVRILTSIEPVDFASNGPHAAIRVGLLPGQERSAGPRIDLVMMQNWSGIHADFLFEDRMVPVCATRLLGGAASVTAADLCKLPLIHTTSRRHAWADWLRSQGVRGPLHRDPALEFGHFFMGLQAARSGQGVALLPDVVVAHGMLGDLVCPTPISVPSAGNYFLLLPKERLQDPVVVAFRRWLLAEASSVRSKVAERFGDLRPLD